MTSISDAVDDESIHPGRDGPLPGGAHPGPAIPAFAVYLETRADTLILDMEMTQIRSAGSSAASAAGSRYAARLIRR